MIRGMAKSPNGHSAGCTAAEDMLEPDGTRRKLGSADSDCALEKVPFILLMRHAKHIPAEALPPESSSKRKVRFSAFRRLANLLRPSDADRSEAACRKLSSKGDKETQAVAERLKEHIDESWVKEQNKKSWVKYRVAGIITADSDEAMATAKIVRDVLQEKTLRKADLLELETVKLLKPKNAFGSDSFKENGSLGLAKELRIEIGCLARRVSASREGNAILIVGHQPILGWLGYALVEEAYPLAHSEVLCLDQKRVSPGLRWTISPSNLEAVKDLKEKIRSKMEVAKLLSSFLGAGLSFLLVAMANEATVAGLRGHVWPFVIGSICLLAALGCFLWTMCSYDTLLMPDRMWAETPHEPMTPPAWLVERPPSPVHWILYQNMIRVWHWQFMPATGLMLAGLWMLASAVFVARLFPAPCVACNYYSVLAAIALLVIAGKGWKHWRDFVSAAACPRIISKVRHLCGPWLGSED